MEKEIIARLDEYDLELKELMIWVPDPNLEGLLSVREPDPMFSRILNACDGGGDYQLPDEGALRSRGRIRRVFYMYSNSRRGKGELLSFEDFEKLGRPTKVKVVHSTKYVSLDQPRVERD